MRVKSFHKCQMEMKGIDFWFLVFASLFRLLAFQSLEMDLTNENETYFSPAVNCRTETGFNLPFDVFRMDTCARCYFYLPPWAFSDNSHKLRYNPRRGLLFDPRNNATYEADPDNASHPIFETFQSDLFARKWIACCRAALQCCEKMTSDPLFPTEHPHCPRTWDGWQCWPDTPGGRMAQVSCQEHVYFMSEPPPCTRYAVKSCWPNGTWFINEWRSEWSNYSGCGRVEGIRRLQHFHIATYSISILFLFPAVVIFMTYKQLQVYRITMHKNLFASLLLNAGLAIAFKTIVILDELDHSGNRITLLEENGVGCRLLYILTKYSRMTTYMWMFCEGFYLHKLIAAAFAEQKSLTMFYLIGWVFPVLPVSTFALLRWSFADEQCWAVPVKPYEWVTNSPNLLSLVLNLAFLCNIIRVLVTKLRATHANEPSQFRKAVRATLVLVPLFGLHFFLVIYRPQSGECSTLEGYTFFSYAMDGLQGFLVSLIFCYLNGEIQGLLRRSFERLRMQQKLASSEWRRSTRSEHGLSRMPTGGANRGGALPCPFGKQYVHDSLLSLTETIPIYADVSTCMVMELIRRSCYRLRLRYSLEIRPSSATQLSYLSDLSTPGDRRRSRISIDGATSERERWRRHTRTDLQVASGITRKHFGSQSFETSLIISD